jgi:hypothetical protein
MLEMWELIIGRKQHKIGKDGGDFCRKPRPDKGCSETDDESSKTENVQTAEVFHRHRWVV